MKHFKLAALAITLILTTACKNEKENEPKTAETSAESTIKFVAKPEATKVKWTAYKTTEKKAVGGEFTTVNFENKQGATAVEALNGLEFSIPVKSLFTKDEGRDAKIKEFFFGAMLNTELIRGKVNHVDGAYTATLTMNGETKDLPLEVNITDERRVTMNAVMQLKDWNALDALASLNKVCYELHKGPDGISKTWEEVGIEVSTYLRKN
ncbi:MAG: YceI family protein [Winogradskyella sp.]|uniref:YceI family protein n=1 Tax=Winogradskyella sp. TaxID=1883156 RepID=UPI0025F1AE0E|nr:YceI family protein [Winogradskyella sp.]NRB59383.1 YceI family protein [Winogradskyella sp.]